MPDTINLLQIKIENAKRELSDDTINAINAVPWQATILKMKETRGYSFEQLDDLKTETELLLCGLLEPKDYPVELKKRMEISEAQANDLINEMNHEVFLKIKEELIQIMERKEEFAKNQGSGTKAPQIKIVPKIISVADKTNPPTPKREDASNVTPVHHLGEQDEKDIYSTLTKDITLGDSPASSAHPALAQKLVTPVQIPSVKTEHTLENITKATAGTVDPYREIPE